MSIYHWPKQERPREKLLSQGATMLSEAELLAIFFRTGTRGKSAVDLGRDTLKHFNNLRGLFNANLEEFCQISGLGCAKYAQLQAVLELSQRYLFEHLQQQDVLENIQQAKQYLMAKLASRKQEIFVCLFLNSKQRLLAYVELFRGTINRTDVYLGEVVKKALHYHAAAVIIAHNHPSGDPTPSQSDCRLTRTLAQALRLVDIRLLDHIVVGINQTISFAQHGLLEND